MEDHWNIAVAIGFFIAGHIIGKAHEKKIRTRVVKNAAKEIFALADELQRQKIKSLNGK